MHFQNGFLAVYYSGNLNRSLKVRYANAKQQLDQDLPIIQLNKPEFPDAVITLFSLCLGLFQSPGCIKQIILKEANWQNRN